MAMDPCNTGTVSLDEFREVLIQLCVSLSDTELETVTSKFTTRNDGRYDCIFNYMFFFENDNENV